MRVVAFLTLILLMGGCPATKPAGTIVVPRRSMPGTSDRHSVIYRNDPKTESAILLCAVPKNRAWSIPGEDPYEGAIVGTLSEPLVVYRYDSKAGTFVQEKPEIWLTAQTPVGELHWSNAGAPGIKYTDTLRQTPVAGTHFGFDMWSPNDPGSGKQVYADFAGSQTTHTAILSGATKDRRGILGTGGAVRGPYYVQVFRTADGSQVGTTMQLELGEETLFEPDGGWTYDGRFIVLYHMMRGHVWIIPTPEVTEAHARKAHAPKDTLP